LHQSDLDRAELHGNRMFNDQGMSAKAQREAAAADAASGDHVPAVPVTPLRPRLKPGPQPTTQTPVPA
jgi:hypothetical protein